MVLAAERLEEIPPEDPILLEARRLLAGDPLSEDRLATLSVQQPFLPAFALAFRQTARCRPDLRDGNLLRRGRYRGLNDPFGTCLTEGELHLLAGALPVRPWMPDDLPFHP
jgi:hypothetical protein